MEYLSAKVFGKGLLSLDLVTDELGMGPPVEKQKWYARNDEIA
jgi:hypothetical protein